MPKTKNLYDTNMCIHINISDSNTQFSKIVLESEKCYPIS